MKLYRLLRYAAGALSVSGCVGVGGPDAGFDGGFPDAPVVSLPPSRIIDESGDLGLLMQVRLPPGMTSHGELLYSSVEVTTHDLATGELVWVDTEESPVGYIDGSSFLARLHPGSGVLRFGLAGSWGGGTFDYDPRSESLLEAPSDGWTGHPLDFGTFTVSRIYGCGSLDRGLTRVIEASMPSFNFCFSPAPRAPRIGPRAAVWAMRKGPGGTLMLDVHRYGPPELRMPEDPWNTAPVEWFESRVEGVYDVFLVEPETAVVVGTGERLLPHPSAGDLGDATEDHADLVDRAGRTYMTVGGDDTVSRQTIYRTGFDGTVEEVVLDWGDATECLLTRIVAVGPEGHLLTRQRPEEASPVSIVCLFAPDGSFVLSLPPDPDRRWIGFSDPVQWY